jgi:hypothetical protein
MVGDRHRGPASVANRYKRADSGGHTYWIELFAGGECAVQKDKTDLGRARSLAGALDIIRSNSGSDRVDVKEHAGPRRPGDPHQLG